MERQESGSVLTHMTKADVLRRIADYLDAGAAAPISLTLYQGAVHLLCDHQVQWEQWATEFGLSPLDAVYDARFDGCSMYVENEALRIQFLPLYDEAS